MPNVVTAFRAGAAVAQRLPDPLLSAAIKGLGTAAARLPSDRRFMAERNLRRIHGAGLGGRELRRLVDEAFVSYARYYGESFRLPVLGADAIDAGLRVEGMQHLLDARAQGNGVLVCLPHLGGWEWSAFWCAVCGGIPVTAVVEPLEPPELFEWFAAFRRALGMHVVPLGPAAGTAVMRALRENHAIALLCDRDLEGNGVEVEFFGERTTVPAGPATLALRTGAPILPTAMYFDGAGHRTVLRPPLAVERQGRLREDVARITQALITELEALIRAAPEQWHLLQPNWPSDREALTARHARRR